jgi:peptidyl-prolyl cis-trans isomerase C
MRWTELNIFESKHQPLSGLLILAVFMMLILFFGCSRRKEGTLGYVNGEDISVKDFTEFYHSRPRVADWSSKEGKLDPTHVLNALIDKILMEQRAKEIGLDTSPAYEEQMKRFEEKGLVNIFIQKWFDPKVHITESEVKGVIPDSQKKEVQFARICVLKEDEAWEIKKMLDQGADFSSLARTRSIGIDAQNGGVGDFLSPHRGIYPKDVIQVIFNLPIGTISEPQKIREGFAIFKPLKEGPLNSAEMEQVMHYQRSLLFREKKNELIRDLLEKAKKDRNVILHSEAINKIASQKGLSESQYYNPVMAEGEGIRIQWRDLQASLPKSSIQNNMAIWEDPNLLSSILELRINKQIMILEARRLGFDKDTDLKKELERIVQDILARQLMIREVETKIVVTEEDCRKYYQESLALFSEPEMVRASHILLKDKEKADEVLSKLKQGAEFAELAEKYSEYKVTSRKGGDMGFIKPGESGMGHEFDKAAFSLEQGKISEPIDTPFGYQILTITERKAARTIPFEEVKNKIRKDLINRKRKSAFDAYLKSLRSQAKINIDQDLFRQLSQDLEDTGSQEQNQD